MTFEDVMKGAMELNQASMLNAEKRKLGPEAIMFANANGLASCLATGATLRVVLLDMEPEQAEQEMVEMAADIFQQILHNAHGKFRGGLSNLDEMMEKFQQLHPEHDFDELKRELKENLEGPEGPDWHI
jgi:hypothetical protein